MCARFALVIAIVLWGRTSLAATPGVPAPLPERLDALIQNYAAKHPIAGFSVAVSWQKKGDFK